MFLLYIFLSFCFIVTLSSSEEVTSGIGEEYYHHSSSTTEMNVKDDNEIFNEFSLHHEEVRNNLNDSLHSEVHENNGVISAEQATIENVERLFENEINESSIENGEKSDGENVQKFAITTKESVSRKNGEDTCKTKDETKINKNETHSSPITRQNNEYVQYSQYITKASIKEPVTSEFSLKVDVDFSSLEHADETFPGGESKASSSPESETTEKAATEKQEDKDEKTEEGNKIDKTSHISVDKHFKSIQGNVKIGTEHHSSDTSEFASRYSTEPSKESVETRTVEHSLSAWEEHESTFPSIETSQGIGSQKCDTENDERTEHYTAHVSEHHNHSTEIIQEGEFSTTTIVEEAISSKSSTKLRETTSNMSQFEHKESKDEDSFLEPGNSRHDILKEPGYYSNTLEVTQQSERIVKEPEIGSNEESNFSEYKSHSEYHGVTSTTVESDSKENTEESGFPSTKTLKDTITEVIGFSEIHSSTIQELEEKSEEIEIFISIKKYIKSILISYLKAGEDQDSNHESKDFIQSFPNIIEETGESESIDKISGKIRDTFHTSKNNEVLTALEDVEFSQTTAGKVSKIPEKHTKKIESITHKPSSSNGLLSTVKIEKIFVGSEIPCEYCKNSKTLQEIESRKHRIDAGSFQERRSTASEWEAFKNNKEMKNHRESYSTHELVATEERPESAAMEPLTQSGAHEPASHKVPINNQEEKFEETISPTIHKLKNLTQRVQITPKAYDNEKKVSEPTNSAIHPRNILISNHGIEPPQNFNSNMNHTEIMYKTLSRHEDESASLSHYAPRVSQSHLKSCTKRDFEAGIHCFCNISKYLHTLQIRVLKMEQIKSTAHYCESFFQTDLLEMKESSNSRRCRTSIIDFESNVRQRATQLEFDSINGVFESDFTLPLKGKTLYRLPTESVTIHCGNDSIKELIKAPIEEELAFKWAFKPFSSTITEELSTKNNKLVIHRISPKNAGNYICSLINKHSVMTESWHKLEVLNFPIYEIQLNIFYRMNESCSIKTGEDLKWHILKLLGPILCSDKREICNLKVDNPRCLTREEDNYYNITIHVKSNPDMVYFLPSKCSVNCKFSFYENLIHMVYKNAEVFEHTNVSMFSDINQLHLIMFIPHHSTANGYTVTTKLPKIIVTCPAGYGLESTKQRVCVVCPRNTYSKNNNSFCRVCPEGNYQPDPGSESCIKCNSPIDASVCLRMLYTDTNLFKVYIGAFLGVVTLLAIMLVIWRSGLKNKLHDGKVDPLSLVREETNQLLRPDIERGYCKCLFDVKTAAPQIPPVDF